MKKLEPKYIQVGDKVILNETGFEYVVVWISDKSILIKKGETKHFIPKTLIEIFDSLLSTSGYRLFKFKSLPSWFVEKNNIN
jgi:hypothetical protein